MKLNILPTSDFPQLSNPAFWQFVDDMAVASLYDELNLDNKPGLVCPTSNGSHTDMDYATFEKSIGSLKGYFATMCQHGFDNSDFEQLRAVGISQETKMHEATQQINTHKGAIFNFGFVCAGIGQCVRQQIPITPFHICQQIVEQWHYPLLHCLPRQANSHGQKMYQKYGLTGAIELVANGFEIVQQLALPCFKATYAKTHNFEQSATQTLMLLIANLSDTNLAWRGGLAGLQTAQQLALDFLASGGVCCDNWQQAMADMNATFIKNNLSPGGSADLLGVTLMFFRIEHDYPPLI